MRKTIKINELIDFSNKMLMSKHVSQDEKRGIVILLEKALRKCNAYMGYDNFVAISDFESRSVSQHDSDYQEFTRLYYKAPSKKNIKG